MFSCQTFAIIQIKTLMIVHFVATSLLFLVRVESKLRKSFAKNEPFEYPE